MFTLVPLAVIVLVAIGFAMSRRRPTEPLQGQTPTEPHDASAEQLHALLREWQGAGLLTPEQVSRIETFEHRRVVVATPVAAPPTAAPAVHPQRSKRVPVVAEALGYLGGILGIVGLTLLVTKYWSDMGTSARIGLSAGAAVLLTIGGFLARESADPALARFRWFVWFVASAATAVTGGVIAVDLGDATSPATTALACTGAAALHSGLLWWWRERPVQQFTAVGTMLATVALATWQFVHDGVPGITLWAAGATVVVVGLAHLTTFPTITVACGLIASVGGGLFITTRWEGFGFATASASALFALWLAETVHPVGRRIEHVVPLVLGAVAMLIVGPQTVTWFGQGAGLLTGATVWVLGACLVVMAAEHWVRNPHTVEIAGGLLIVAGAAVTAMQSEDFGTVFGLLTAVALLAVGTMPDRVLLSLAGSLGLLVNVPWSINHFFPGEGRAPLLILVSGVVIVGVAVLLTRMGGRFRQLRH